MKGVVEEVCGEDGGESERSQEVGGRVEVNMIISLRVEARSHQVKEEKY